MRVVVADIPGTLPGMTRVLERASTLISLFGGKGDRHVALGQVARDSGLSPATCSRLLKSLVNLGWIDQDGNRGDYRLGPRLFALARGQAYRAADLAVWRPRLYELAATTRATVVLSTLRHGRRQILYEVSLGRGQQGLDEHEDCYTTASGRLLLAMLARRERDRLIERLGMPGTERWPGIIDRRELDAALAELRRQRRLELINRPTGLATAAAVVADGHGGWLAVGAYHRHPGRLRQLGDAVAAAARRPVPDR